MSNYPGNASLSNAVKDRVLSTFQQTLALYKQGRSDEAIQGCGLILRMDPTFEPAKKLMEKARNPAAPIDIDALVAPSAGDRMAEAQKAMAARDFPKVIQITTEILTNDLMNEQARILNEQAREKAEAAPFVDQFIKKGEQAIASGNVAAARAALEKIKSLDADDTAVARIEAQINKIDKPAASPSFVVDAPASQPGRGASQASDFGFTFEEEKAHESALGSFSFDSPFSTDTGSVPPITPPSGFAGGEKKEEPKSSTPFSFDTPPPPSPSPFAGGFSFDTPPATPAAPSGPGPAQIPGTAQEFDFATASIETSPEDQKKVQQYLAEGDQAFGAGDYQKAIDLWSRVFLIDVTNDQASERIEKAKAKRRTMEQDLETIIAAGTQAFDAGDRKTAKEKFEQAQKIDPTNMTVQEYLGKLTEVPAEGGATGFEAPFTPPPATPVKDIFADEAPLGGAPLVPPSEPAAAPAAATPAARKVAAKPKVAPAPAAAVKREFPVKLIGIVAVVVVLAAGGWFAWSKFMSKPAYDPAATEATFKQAQTLANKGQYDAAIAMLQDVKVADPQHDKALSMIADLQHKKGQASETVNGRPAAAVYQEAITAGKSAYDARDYDAAKKAFDNAAKIKPLPPDAQAMYDNAAQQVSKLEGAKALFNEQRYQDALTNLVALQQQDPQNQSIRRMITDAHFNLGAQALQEERLPDAIQQFDEVLKLDPTDDLAKRSKELAERYSGEHPPPKDLLYKIYVKYLPMRKAS